MSKLNKAYRALALFLLPLFLVACLGTGVKTLGKKTTNQDGNGETDSETFSVTFAYRDDPTTDDTRIVTLQGVRDIPSANFSLQCGTSGAGCECLFYLSSSDTAPVVGSTADNGFSLENNSFSCEIPGAVDPDLYTLVQLQTLDGTKSTGLVDLTSNNLTLQDVLGDLSTDNVRGMYRYGCVRTFLEGEGVTATTATCVANQRLGLISATYNYYYWKGVTEAGNFADTDLGTSTVYDPNICNKEVPKLTCDIFGAATLRWGLYNTKTGPFQIGVSFSPKGSGTASTYGYAAKTDSAGNCPVGLVKVQSWIAVPQSIVQGMYSGGTSPSSSFINTGISLSNTVLEATQPSDFLVNRQPNATTCDAASPYSCAAATYGGSVQVQSIDYVGLTPIICVIPSSLVDDVM